ncbi:hypothetical protein ABC195_01260 [Microbacterium sp. 2P01SA-2]|uniref:hypothetical protein n=1 Tax=unclassified Microbacterium TaxID=2609290 RepID=UPI0039A1DD72
MDLNDQLTPNEHGELRDRVVGGVKRLRAARARRSRIVAGAAASALVAVVVAGVAFAALRPDDRIATPVETSTPTPTPTPTPTADPTSSVEERPETFVPRRCEELITMDDWDELLGAGSLSGEEQRLAWGTATFDAAEFDPSEPLGGVRCVRYAASQDPRGRAATSVEVSVYPAASISDDDVDYYRDKICGVNYGTTTCVMARVVGDWWVFAGASLEPESDHSTEPSTEILTAAIDLASVRVVGEPAASVPDGIVEGPGIADCDSFSMRIGLSEFVGEYVIGYVGGGLLPDELVFERLGTRWICPIRSSADDSRLGTIQLYPGAHRQWDDRTAGLERIDLGEGLSAALVPADQNRPSTLLATDGSNVVTVAVQEGETDRELARRALAALGGAL